MKKNRENERVKSAFCYSYLAASVVFAGAVQPALAQQSGESSQAVEEIMVTARRKEESIQDVPIAISIYSQEELDKANIVSGADLAIYNPSLSANNRFGSDNATFAIRGFTQEYRTTASVGIYFAEVVAPRGSSIVTGGDGAGPGNFFDLQNVQVLKGPQGTLFGRNTTGGAVLLTPQKPTDALEGYIEGGAGNYDMRRAQGAINIPLGDNFRARFGFDSQVRDGYLHNISGIGPEYFADVDYVAARASLVWDISDSIENYSILSFTESENNGSTSTLFGCNTDPEDGAPASVFTFNDVCAEQLALQGDDFHTTYSVDPNPKNEIKSWQFINTTSWDISDTLTFKNIFSYAELEQNYQNPVFGIGWLVADTREERFSFTGSQPLPGVPSNSQTSLIEEIQFQGTSFDGDLIWQAGLYYEQNDPDGSAGSISPFFLYCPDGIPNDPFSMQCVDPLRNPAGGFVQRSVAKVEFSSRAVFGEMTYSLSDVLNLTAGLRYTEDETKSEVSQVIYVDGPELSSDPNDPIVLGPPTDYNCVFSYTEKPDCISELDVDTDAVTGNIAVNFYPAEPVMTYAKYARGYRQGSINVLGPEGLRPFDAEEVDSYEIGTKIVFEGAVPGNLNIAVFYNDLTNQQIQENVVSNLGVSTTAIINAGKSVISGIELDTLLQLPWDMTLNLAYTFLDTELKEYNELELPEDSLYDDVQHVAVEGGDLTFSPKHNITATINQRLPLPVEWGDMMLGATYVYTDEQISSANSDLGFIPSYQLWNFNFSWMQIAGTNFDATLFVTNAFDEEVMNYVPGLYNILGNEFRIVGEPQMYGAKLRYTFE